MGSETAPLLLTDEELTQPNKSAALVSTVTYRSRMVAPMSELELHRLAKGRAIPEPCGRRDGPDGL